MEGSSAATDAARNNESLVRQAGIGNLLLASLNPDDFALLAPHLQRVQLELNSVIAQAGAPIDTLFFPEAGVIGFADVLKDGQRLAVALTGRDGFVGWPLVLGNDRWPHQAIVRAERGTALRIRAADLVPILAGNERIRTTLLRYASSLVAQMARTIVSNLIHPVECRTARWLLLYHDRVQGDEIAITHEELGVMLGVRRSSITDALHQLEGAGAVRGYRGRVLVRDRARLEALAGETYGFAEAEYRRLLAPTAALA
ncbi:cAMP-binding domain of CRP or a regulatory subunit of cAMP-dependent protein kinases [Sphingomonas jatrophae]|uniref:cAMP-binding domain of CRP or a regulatory subunit of cAMP-dependent protein kinases n=2 Tax=Sphingomonas jatrophae TaxID=1166337 RepID=A0A1I6J9W8_9SPHN|nr:cAMP-binding domain of CRP or a regulatory subunit of cAMP-dependent protein kinases [Sphingomonas jatrophae]